VCRWAVYACRANTTCGRHVPEAFTQSSISIVIAVLAPAECRSARSNSAARRRRNRGPDDGALSTLTSARRPQALQGNVKPAQACWRMLPNVIALVGSSRVICLPTDPSQATVLGTSSVRNAA
jgi:hypothetical protein